MKMYIRGEKSAETMNQQAKTLEIESPFYERHAVRTTRNVSNCLVNIFSYGKQCKLERNHRIL